MREIGSWLKTNGEAIYGSKLWRKAAEGPTNITEGQFADSDAKLFTSGDIRFTVNGGYVYAICLNMKDKDSVCIKSLSKTADAHKPDFSGIIKGVEVLGYDKDPEWTQDEEGLKIKTHCIKNDIPVVFKIEID